MSSNQQLDKPFAETTPDDHRASIWVATLMCLAFVVLGVLTRVYVRFRAFGLDDYVMIGAFVVGLAEFCTIFGGLVNGLGKSTTVLSTDATGTAGQIFLASEALFIIALYMVKHSVLCTVERLLGPDYKREKLACKIFHGILALCALASLLLVLVGCDAPNLFTRERSDTCKFQVSRWIAVATIDAVTEVCVFAAFCFFVSTLQLQKQMKLTLSMLLAFRLGCIAFASVHAKYINAYVSTAGSSNNAGIAVVGAIVWQQLNLCYSLVSALLIALKSFLASFDTTAGWGENTTFKASSNNQSGNGSRGGGLAYALKPMKGSKAMRSWRSQHEDEERPRGKDEKTNYTAKVQRGEERENGSVASGRSGISQHPMIRYEMRYEVTHEDNREKV